MGQYTKEPLSFSDQLRLLQQRGLRIADPSQAMLYLERVGYYRLMGYLFPFRLPHSDHYGPDAAFEHAIAHYQFDQGLRILVMEAIEHIEIAVRAAATYRISHTYGAFGHRNPRNISWAKAWHDEWLAKIDGEVCRSRETFVLHYADTYSSPAYPQVPLWMASEVMSLGAVSKWVASMHHGDRKAIAARFDLPAPVFENWLHVVSVVRNITAHHGRLWNRSLRIQPKRPKNGPWQYMATLYPTNRPYFILQMLKRLLAASTLDANDWRNRVDQHLRPLLETPIHQLSMGAPGGWEEHPAWR